MKPEELIAKVLDSAPVGSDIRTVEKESGSYIVISSPAAQDKGSASAPAAAQDKGSTSVSRH